MNRFTKSFKKFIIRILYLLRNYFKEETKFPRGTTGSGDGSNLKIGKNTSFGGNVFLFGTAPIEIGDNTMVGYGTIIHTSTHNYNVQPMWKERIDRPIKIGKNVWIGTGSIIMPGVIIENNSVIGAGSVVTARVPEGAIVAGNPARVIKHRDKKIIKKPIRINLNESVIVKKSYLKNVCK